MPAEHTQIWAGRRVRFDASSADGLINMTDAASGIQIRAVGVGLVRLDHGCGTCTQVFFYTISDALNQISRAEAACGTIRAMLAIGQL